MHRSRRRVNAQGPPPLHSATRSRSSTGFSLTELMLVVGIMGIVMAIAVIQVAASRSTLRGDGAMRVVLGQLRMARELAITQRSYIRLAFTNGDTVSVEREEATAREPITLSTTYLEGGVQFRLTKEAPDTPERYGNSAAIDFGNARSIKFSPDGSLVNQVGDTINGTVFMAIPAADLSARAVTVLGATGRIRAYRWNGQAWKAVP